MNEETKKLILDKLVIINKERQAILNLMSIIDNSILAIRELMKEIEQSYNRVLMEIYKEDDTRR